jgi:predicted RNA-binding Zn-ribbon protein involved in translation (DUF1610 family)
MSRDASLHSVNCASCGAGLDVLGGGRVTVHICPYCGAELDATEGYRLLRAYDRLPDRPDSPMRIGDTATFFDAQFTVIGTLGLQEAWHGQIWTWVEHQLFSQTHGYAWLSVEEGHLVFSRRHRTDVWLSSARVERSDNRPVVSLDGKRFHYFETTEPEITFAEGEFTWRPSRGSKSTVVSAISDDQIVEFQQSGRESEVYIGSYITKAQAETAFGRDLALHQSARHLIEPQKFRPLMRYFAVAASGFAVLALFMWGYLSTGKGTEVVRAQYDVARDLPVTIPLELTAGTGLTEVSVSTEISQGWASFEMELTDPGDQVLFEVERTSERYSGRDSDGTWTEGNQRAQFRFLPEVTGTYELSIGLSSIGNWSPTSGSREVALNQSHRKIDLVHLRVYKNGTSGTYAFLLVLGYGIVGGGSIYLIRLTRRRRFALGDWDDED